MNFYMFAAITLGLVMVSVNSFCALIAYALAKKRGIKPMPAFFIALFGSVAAVFYIAMFPVKREFRKYPDMTEE